MQHSLAGLQRSLHPASSFALPWFRQPRFYRMLSGMRSPLPWLRHYGRRPLTSHVLIALQRRSGVKSQPDRPSNQDNASAPETDGEAE